MIQSIQRVLKIAIMALLLVWLFLFALANDTVVPLNLVLWVAPAQHVSWWLLGAFGAGLLAGWMLAVVAGWVRAARRRKAGVASGQ